MKMVGTIFVDDVRRLTSNIASIIIVIGLTVIPGLFTWFNVAACWDPFANTKNLQFAIANEDEGYKGDMLPLRINIGDEVVNTLRANTQLDWDFTKTKQEAIDGTKSGKYYAAVIIPKDFSKTMLTFFSSDADHAMLDYYDNEKLNALAPKVTGQGADTIAASINEMFAKTITDTALNIASSMVDMLDRPESKDRLTDFNKNVGDLSSALADSASTLRSYSQLTGSAQTLMSSSKDLIAQTKSGIEDAVGDLSGSKKAVADLSGALGTSTDALQQALNTSAASMGSLAGSVDTLFDSADGQANTSAAAIKNMASNVSAEAKAYATTRDRLQALLDTSSLPQNGAVRAGIQSAINRIGAAADTLTQLADRLNAAADDITNHVNVNDQDRQSIKDLAAQAKSAVSGISADFDTSIKPDLEQMNAAFTTAAGQLTSSVTTLKDALGDLDGSADTANAQITKVRALLDDAAGELDTASKKLSDFNGQLTKALNTGDMGLVKQVLASNSSQLATTLSAPVELKTKALFPVANFGTSLTPFYTFLPLWVGAILTAVTLKVNLSRKRLLALGEPKPWQQFLGHYLIYGVIGLMQSTFSLAGTLLFLRVQAVHPWLFMLDGWFSSIVFSFFTYTLIASFGNVGKAIAVLFLVMQISGSDAAYPLAILPHFLSDVSPWLPVTYSTAALRSAIAGIYQNDYWIAMGKLALFLVPLLIIGFVLRRGLVRFNVWYEKKVESTKLIG